mmetsp:Transcript_21201/g.67142  ORF Transcript_21201/g.67142 Transcript_21201/m.67142 type:complete len:233 (+) Transcript_21201:345-1043(+)
MDRSTRWPLSRRTCSLATGSAGSRPARSRKTSSCRLPEPAPPGGAEAWRWPAPPAAAAAARPGASCAARGPRISRTRPSRTTRSGSLSRRRSPAVLLSRGAFTAIPTAGRRRSPPSARSGSSRARSRSQAENLFPVRSTTFRATPPGCSSRRALGKYPSRMSFSSSCAEGSSYGTKARSPSFTPSQKNVNGRGSDDLLIALGWPWLPMHCPTPAPPSSSTRAFRPSTLDSIT